VKRLVKRRRPDPRLIRQQFRWEFPALHRVGIGLECPFIVGVCSSALPLGRLCERAIPGDRASGSAGVGRRERVASTLPARPGHFANLHAPLASCPLAEKLRLGLGQRAVHGWQHLGRRTLSHRGCRRAPDHHRWHLRTTKRRLNPISVCGRVRKSFIASARLSARPFVASRGAVETIGYSYSYWRAAFGVSLARKSALGIVLMRKRDGHQR